MRIKQSSRKRVGVMVESGGMAVGVVSGMGSKYRKMEGKVGLEKVRKLGGKVVKVVRCVVVVSGAYP